MKTAIIFYSYTGNNEALAKEVASKISADLIKVTEPRSRSMSTIMLDMIFNRTPKVQPSPSVLEKYDQILFMGPVWMGQAASPLRGYFSYIKEHTMTYSFASISGGALNNNPKLEGDLIKRNGSKPDRFVDLHISDLLPSDPKPTTKDTSAYRLNDHDKTKLSEMIVISLENV